MTELEKKAQKAIDVMVSGTAINEIYEMTLDEMGHVPSSKIFHRKYIDKFSNNKTEYLQISDEYTHVMQEALSVGFYYGFRAAVKLMKSLNLFDEEESE